jgi:copper chaperone
METFTMNKTTIKITGMSCNGCVKSITRALTAQPGVATAEVSLERAEAVIDFDPGKTSRPQLAQAIEDAGFSAEQ